MLFPSDGATETLRRYLGAGIFDTGDANSRAAKAFAVSLCNDERLGKGKCKGFRFLPVRPSVTGVYEGTRRDTMKLLRSLCLQ